MKTGLPVASGYLPIAIAFGLLAKANGLNVTTSTLMSALVFAGASQFVAVNLLAAGAGAGEIILTTLILNIRHLLMSAALAPRLHRQPVKTKAVIAFGVTDETFSVVSLQPAANSDPGFIVGVNTVAYLGWVVGTALGGLLVKGFPPLLQSSMGLALYTMFIGLLVPGLRESKANLTVSLVALVLSMVMAWGPPVFRSLAKGWQILLITVVACTVGALLFPEEDREEEQDREGKEDAS